MNAIQSIKIQFKLHTYETIFNRNYHFLKIEWTDFSVGFFNVTWLFQTWGLYLDCITKQTQTTRSDIRHKQGDMDNGHT